MLRVKRLAIVAALLSWPAISLAQSSPQEDVQNRMIALEKEVQALRAELEAVRIQLAGSRPSGEAATVPAAAVPPTTPSPAVEQPPPTSPSYGAASQAPKIFNPDIGVIGNFVSATGESQGGSPSIAPIPFATLQESEVSSGHRRSVRPRGFLSGNRRRRHRS